MTKDYRWIAKNFGKLMDLYGGRYVAVVNGKVVAAGSRPDVVEERASRATGAKTPSVVRVPRKDNLAVGGAPLRLFHLS
jgi:hypothetical protein